MESEPDQVGSGLGIEGYEPGGPHQEQADAEPGVTAGPPQVPEETGEEGRHQRRTSRSHTFCKARARAEATRLLQSPSPLARASASAAR